MQRKKKPAAVIVLVLLAIAVWWIDKQRATVEVSEGAEAILEAFREKRSRVWVEAEGEIVHLLPDDRVPPRHQNFLVEVAEGHTIKISHNVDISPKVPIQKGHRIGFRGRYEYNEKGGVVHWTHHDPQGRQKGGWLEYEGATYR